MVKSAWKKGGAGLVFTQFFLIGLSLDFDKKKIVKRAFIGERLNFRELLHAVFQTSSQKIGVLQCIIITFFLKSRESEF